MRRPRNYTRQADLTGVEFKLHVSSGKIAATAPEDGCCAIPVGRSSTFQPVLSWGGLQILL